LEIRPYRRIFGTVLLERHRLVSILFLCEMPEEIECDTLSPCLILGVPYCLKQAKLAARVWKGVMP